MPDTTPVPSYRWWWEDFPVGSIRELGSVSVTRDAVIDFARQFDPQPFHVDDAAAQSSPFGRIAASGWHTCSLLMRMICDGYLLESASLGSPGVENIKWVKPVYPGDTLSGRMTVLAARPMMSKPHAGLVQSRSEVFNQHGELVMSMEGWGMFRRRQPEMTNPGSR